MRILVAHNQITDLEDRPDELDVLVQARAVEQALTHLGHDVLLHGCTLDLTRTEASLSHARPCLVFNLVESLGGHGRLIHILPCLLEALDIPFTGSPAQAMYRTSDKIAAKEHMVRAGLPTPGWHGPVPDNGTGQAAFPAGLWMSGRPWIVKSVWEHASLGLGEDAVVIPESLDELNDILTRRASGLGGTCFAEEYVEGREFNIGLLAGTPGPQVLPPAEILFDGFGPERPRIVGYLAKWDEASFEYRHTPRSFDFPPSDRALLEEMIGLSRRCWEVFGLKGYARVDFRVDDMGRPCILEVNTNPCLSPDAGFAAALDRAGIPFHLALKRILCDALPRPAQERCWSTAEMVSCHAANTTHL